MNTGTYSGRQQLQKNLDRKSEIINYKKVKYINVRPVIKNPSLKTIHESNVCTNIPSPDSDKFNSSESGRKLQENPLETSELPSVTDDSNIVTETSDPVVNQFELRSENSGATEMNNKKMYPYINRNNGSHNKEARHIYANVVVVDENVYNSF